MKCLCQISLKDLDDIKFNLYGSNISTVIDCDSNSLTYTLRDDDPKEKYYNILPDIIINDNSAHSILSNDSKLHVLFPFDLKPLSFLRKLFLLILLLFLNVTIIFYLFLCAHYTTIFFCKILDNFINIKAFL